MHAQSLIFSLDHLSTRPQESFHVLDNAFVSVNISEIFS